MALLTTGGRVARVGHANYHKHFFESKSLRRCPAFFSNYLSLFSQGLFRFKSCESFLNGDALSYMERMYQSWMRDHSSVHASWNVYFNNLNKSFSIERSLSLPSCSPLKYSPTKRVDSFSISHDIDARVMQLIHDIRSQGYMYAKVNPLPVSFDASLKFGLHEPYDLNGVDPSRYSLSSDDLNNIISREIASEIGLSGPISTLPRLKDVIQRLQKIYCRSIGVELSHIKDQNILNFIYQRIEQLSMVPFSSEKKQKLFDCIAKTELFENFCNLKYNVVKRFGIQGCESVIAAVKQIVEHSVLMDVEHVVIGCSHRGRINLLANVLSKPLHQIFKEFNGETGFSLEQWGKSGDVKYHLGAQSIYVDEKTAKQVSLHVMPNPSHLEATNPVTLGYVRAVQDMLGPENSCKVLPLLLHGDASFSAQGIVYEVVQMSNLRPYHVKGTIHLIVNNQIGFTTDMRDQKSSQYPTDIMKIMDVPIFHINADDPEGCILIAQLALEFRQKFNRDVILDIVGYRRWGHNELDMPKFTQPLMYYCIERHPTLLNLYSKQLLHEGVLSEKAIEKKKNEILDTYNSEYDQSKLSDDQVYQKADNESNKNVRSQKLKWSHKPLSHVVAKPIESCEQNYRASSQANAIFPTGLPRDQLLDVGLRISTLPEWLNPHPGVQKVYQARKEALITGMNIDFGLAEALAFGTLLHEGYNIRLSGQDAERGTFSHRHAVVHHQPKIDNASNQNNAFEPLTYCPLSTLNSNKIHVSKDLFQSNLCKENKDASCDSQMNQMRSEFSVSNSLLSEYAALGFEFGYAALAPHNLCVWEAQFGDFANGAQIIIDQYIASGETKWGLQCGLVLLLPHGYDGQGPEHSSARIERFLQLCDDRDDKMQPDPYHDSIDQSFHDYNLQVVNCTTPANFFHVLRRQLHREFRKPLIIFSPKRMLRMRATFSRISDFVEGSHFMSYIPDLPYKTDNNNQKEYYCAPNDVSRVDESIRRLILCSGQVYYDLVSYREKLGHPSVAVSRIEQLAPFPYEHILRDVRRYPNLEEVFWVQEEHMNMGPWPYVSKRLSTALQSIDSYRGKTQAHYVGRNVLAAPAVGDLGLHHRELESLLKDAFR